MASTVAFKNLLLAASDINTLSLHTADPGAAGTANEVTGGGYSRQSCTFAAAASGGRALSTAVNFTLTPNQAVAWLGFWAGATFRGPRALSGDTSANALGQYQITTATQLTLADVA